ncbi:putative lipoprotein [Leptospira weilii serovar Topaz str. LT2116]|uniref:Putative lipoprotein n=1 Tax=Leptospira weilii serovar Topaz str. LT2116 TaxID=1088540 RepID=M3GV99_9LEPT|nr:putative lipoprotein [Leptospira weilii serovar Topaz str. LT2116]
MYQYFLKSISKKGFSCFLNLNLFISCDNNFRFYMFNSFLV